VEPKDFNITKRSLLDTEIDFIVKEIKKTPNIIGYTRREWRNFKDVWVAEADGDLVGVCVNNSLLSGWGETSILYVVERFRNNGIGKALYKEAFADLRRRKRHIYYVSKNPITLKWMKNEQMKFVKMYQLPWPVLLHILKKVLSFYRIKELIRKSLVFKKEGKFLHAYK